MYRKRGACTCIFYYHFYISFYKWLGRVSLHWIRIQSFKLLFCARSSTKADVSDLYFRYKDYVEHASKIIDRIIAQEGFEHVLAVDHDKESPTLVTATPQPSSTAIQPSSFKPPPASGPKPRPQSVIMDRRWSTSNPNSSVSPSLQTSKPRPPQKHTIALFLLTGKGLETRNAVTSSPFDRDPDL